MKTRRIWLLVSVILALAVAAGGLDAVLAQALSRTTSQRVMKSVVQLIAVDVSSSGIAQPKWGGSGTIISADGLILTNCHVAYPRAMTDDPADAYDELVVALTTRSDQPPQMTYVAEVMQYDPDLDLAVVRVSQTLDGKAVDRSKLNLPALALGDSDLLEIGDALYCFGYPGIGGETITLTGGSVSGFTQERGVKGRAWIKTDAAITGGNSGGTGVNDQGELVGVPTQGGSGGSGDIVDCRPVADTNGDGRVDDNDTCVPFGGFINALRPVNLAKPLIEAAGHGLGPQPTPEAQPTPQRPTGAPRVSHVFFAPALNDDDQPVTIVDSFPSGAEVIYVFFDYENWQDGAAFQPVEWYEGKLEADVWNAAAWSGGPSGQWWLSISNNPLGDGTYEFAIRYDNQEYPLGKVTVGGAEKVRPAFANIVLSAADTTGFVFAAGTQEISADFEYANTTPQTAWSYRAYVDGKPLVNGSGKPLQQSSGAANVTLTNRQGFAAGTYRLELYIGTRLAAESDFWLAGQTVPGLDEGPFGPITFGEAVDSQLRPVRPATAFKSGIPEVFGTMDFHGMTNGWEWSRRWYIDEKAVLDQNATWDRGESGSFWVSVNKRGGLPDGDYLLEMLVEGQVVQTGTFTIGSATVRPTPTPTRVPAGKGVEVYGRITDADTGRGISGAGLLVLQPGITLDAFEQTEAEVYAYGQADRNGNYELSAPLVRGETYSIRFGADGYQVIGEDGVFVELDLPSPYELNVTLQRLR